MIIDISNEIYTEIKNTLSVDTYKSAPKKIPTFPCVVVEFSGATMIETFDSGGENHNSQFIDINIYTQSDDSNQLIIEIRKAIDEILTDKYRMRRETDNRMDNPLDMTIDRWMMRYGYVISKDKIIYGR